MSVFSLIEKLEFTEKNTDISINNIYVSNNHFGNQENIVEFGKDLDTALYNREGEGKRDIINYNIYKYLKDFPRVKKVEFYIDNATTTGMEDFIFWKVLIISDMLEFNKSVIFGRNINFIFKDHKLCLSLIELNKSEYKLLTDKKIPYPDYWEITPNMNKQYKRMKVLFNDE